MSNTDKKTLNRQLVAFYRQTKCTQRNIIMALKSRSIFVSDLSPKSSQNKY